CIEIAQNKAYTALFGVSTHDLFNFIQGDPSLLAGMPTLARMAAWGGGFPIKVDGEIVGAIGLSGAPTVQNDIDCARAALELVSCRWAELVSRVCGYMAGMNCLGGLAAKPNQPAQSLATGWTFLSEYQEISYE